MILIVVPAVTGTDTYDGDVPISWNMLQFLSKMDLTLTYALFQSHILYA